MASSKDLLFDEIDAYNTGFLNVSDGHSIYFEESGNKDGLPVLFLHGGPGDASSPKKRRMYDPEKFRIILFDQRGCGLSTPNASLEGNNTQNLVADIELLREHLGVDKWMVTGASWGSTLSLVYAIAHPERVMGMVLNGIFLAYRVNTDWIHGPFGAARVFPEAYDEYIDYLEEDKQEDTFNAYADIILGSDKEKATEAAIKMLTYQGRILNMDENTLLDMAEREAAEQEMSAEEKAEAQAGFEKFAYTHCVLESHYAKQDYFLEEGHIIQNVDKLKNIPVTLIHGRYDMVCPIKNAYKLQQKMPHANLIVTPNAAHGTSESLAEVMQAYQYMYERLTA